MQGDPSLKSSPYMIVKSDNDRIRSEPGQGAYTHGNGAAQDAAEKTTLETLLLPGVNQRLGMPEKAT